MAEFTNNDREILFTEATLWGISQLLENTSKRGVWQKRIEKLHADVVEIAREMREYNDQWEVSEDD